MTKHSASKREAGAYRAASGSGIHSEWATNRYPIGERLHQAVWLRPGITTEDLLITLELIGECASPEDIRHLKDTLRRQALEAQVVYSRTDEAWYPLTEKTSASSTSVTSHLRSTYTLLIEAGLLGRQAMVSDMTASNAAHTVEYVAAIHAGFGALGMREAHGPDLNPALAYSSYIWRNLASLTSDVLWIEGHGSISKGLLSLPIEEVARVRDNDRGDDWARLRCKLLMFGSCFTASSGVWDLLPRIVERPCVVVGSRTEVQFADGSKYYPNLIATWGLLRGADPTSIAAALTAVAPDVFVAKAVVPEFDGV